MVYTQHCPHSILSNVYVPVYMWVIPEIWNIFSTADHKNAFFFCVRRDRNIQVVWWQMSMNRQRAEVKVQEVVFEHEPPEAWASWLWHVGFCFCHWQMALAYPTMTLSIQVRGCGKRTAPSKKPRWPPCSVRAKITFSFFSGEGGKKGGKEKESYFISSDYKCEVTGLLWKCEAQTEGLKWLRRFLISFTTFNYWYSKLNTRSSLPFNLQSRISITSHPTYIVAVMIQSY